MSRLVTVTCNVCGHEFEISNDDPNYLFGRLYCEEHSVLKRQRIVRDYDAVSADDARQEFEYDGRVMDQRREDEKAWDPWF